MNVHSYTVTWKTTRWYTPMADPQ